MSRLLGVGHLTLLALTPPEVVETAAAAGFDFVGLRVRAVTATERAYDMRPGSPMMAETLGRLADTGLHVRDVEFLPLTEATTREDWMPALEAGAALGATALTVTGADPDRSRLRDTLGQLTVDAGLYGICPLLEPISYQPVSGATDAAGLARETGAGLMLDSLHLQRGGSSLEEVAAIETDLIPVVQLCDGPLVLQTPDDSAERIAALQYEARVERGVIGQGQFPLAALLGVLAADTPVSVEIPHARLQAELTPLEYATLMVQTARTLIDRVDRDASQPATLGA